MFYAIIHNLKEGDAGFNECQAYNKIIGQKPTNGKTLAQKLKLQAQWKNDCFNALLAAQIAAKL